ncbi:MAG: TetR/AcrR family transcriptional regulator [Solirubrobacterales bacterium]
MTQTRAPSQKRPRAAHLGPERRRPQVLDAALELFLERGYEGTSMAGIAEAAGVTKPVVYACFPGKEELFRALLRREEERILGEIQAAFESADLSDPEATLVEGYTAFLGAVAASPEVYRLVFLGEGGGNMAVARRIQRGRAAQVDALSVLARGWLEQRRNGAPREADLDATARLLANAIAGLAEAGARLLLSGVDEWTPESLGPELGRLAAGAQAAV